MRKILDFLFVLGGVLVLNLVVGLAFYMTLGGGFIDVFFGNWSN